MSTGETENARSRRAIEPPSVDALLPLIYEELRRLARAQLRTERADHSLQPTALVHEVYLRLAKTTHLSIRDKNHFLALAARLMRQVLVDYARRRAAIKRGGRAGATVSVDEPLEAADPITVSTGLTVIDILSLDEALDALATLDPRQRDLVELKFFAGLSIDECAVELGVSPATVERDWALAKAWLFQHLSSSP